MVLVGATPIPAQVPLSDPLVVTAGARVRHGAWSVGIDYVHAETPYGFAQETGNGLMMSGAHDDGTATWLLAGAIVVTGLVATFAVGDY